MDNSVLTDDDLLLVAIGLAKSSGNSGSNFVASVALAFEALTQERYPGIPQVYGNGAHQHERAYAVHAYDEAD